MQARINVEVERVRGGNSTEVNQCTGVSHHVACANGNRESHARFYRVHAVNLPTDVRLPVAVEIMVMTKEALLLALAAEEDF